MKSRSWDAAFAAGARFRHVERMPRVLLIALLLGACHASVVPSVRKPDGSYHLQCGASMEGCVKRAEELCKGRGYVVLSGASTRKLYGAELGVSQVEDRQAELDIACADRRGDLPKVVPADSAAPPAPAAAPVPAVPAAPAPAVPAAPAP